MTKIRNRVQFCCGKLSLTLIVLQVFQPHSSPLVEAFTIQEGSCSPPIIRNINSLQTNLPSVLPLKATHDNYEDKDPTTSLLQNDNVNTSTSDHLQSTTTTLLLIILLIATITCTSLPLVAVAVDHPVDFGHLHIPNPLPNADPRYFVSGGVCAAASHGITTPLDVIKTRIQSEPELFNNNNNNNNNNNSNNNRGGSLLNAATTIVQQDGLQALSSGLVPTILGYGFEGALKFGLYESLKPTFVQLLSSSLTTTTTDTATTTTEAYLAASVAAGAVASIVLCPMERTRIRQVTDPQFAKDGFVGGLLRLTKEEGIGSIFYGLPAMLSKQVPYTMAKQVSFDLFAGLLYALALQYSFAANDVKTEVEFFAALSASILACLASHPGDVILTATYKTTTTTTSGSSSSSSNGFVDVITNLYDKKGFNGFFTGITARFFHVGAIITSQLILYDIIKQLLGLPATGTH